VLIIGYCCSLWQNSSNAMSFKHYCLSSEIYTVFIFFIGWLSGWSHQRCTRLWKHSWSGHCVSSRHRQGCIHRFNRGISERNSISVSNYVKQIIVVCTFQQDAILFAFFFACFCNISNLFSSCQYEYIYINLDILF